MTNVIPPIWMNIVRILNSYLYLFDECDIWTDRLDRLTALIIVFEIICHNVK